MTNLLNTMRDQFGDGPVCSVCGRTKPRMDLSPCYRCTLDNVAKAQAALKEYRQAQEGERLGLSVSSPLNTEGVSEMARAIHSPEPVPADFPVEMSEKIIAIDECQEIDKEEMRAMASAMDVGHLSVQREPRIYHPRARTIYIMAPRNQQDIEMLSLSASHWRHLSDAPLDGDMIP